MKRKSGIYVIIVAAILLSVTMTAGAQEKEGSWAVKAGADRLTIGSFRDSYTSLGFNSYTLEWDFVTSPSGDGNGYAASYNWPVFGIGLAYNALDEVKFRSANGHYSGMIAAYGTISRDLLRTGHLGFGYDACLGLSYSSGYYDALTNRANWFFSSPVLFYVAGGGHLTLALSRKLDLVADISVRHNSSARFAYPNGGLNYWGGGISARYRFEERRSPSGNLLKTRKISEDHYTRGWNFELYAGGGIHSCAAEWLAFSKTESRETQASTKLKKWPMASLSFDAIYRLSGRFGLGLTTDAFYCSNTDRLRWADGVLYGEEAVEASKGYSPLSFGGGIVQEVFYKDIAFYVQECLYAYRHMGIHGEHGALYERAGFRYYPRKLDPFFISVCIKAHKFKADYLDFTLGIRL